MTVLIWYRYHYTFKISSSERFMKPGMGMVYVLLVGPHHFLADQLPFWSKYAGEKLSSFVISSPTSPFSTELVPTLEQNRVRAL